jgi:hypothetical protein
MSSQIVEKVSQEKADFSNPVIRWIDYRLPIFTFLHHELNVYPTARNLNYLWNFGSLAGIVLLIMIASGIVLAMSRIGAAYYFVHFFLVPLLWRGSNARVPSQSA